MVRDRVIQNDLTAGVWSDKMQGRSDRSKYYSALSKGPNILVFPQGPGAKTPGTKFIDEVPDSDNATILIPFKHSDTASYHVEFSNILIRFYRTVNGVMSLVQTGAGADYSIASPYASSDLALLQYDQAGDTMFLTHPDYPTQILTFVSNNSWSIAEAEFVRGPFLRENETNTTIKVKGYTIDAVSTGLGGTFTISGDGDLSNIIESGSKITVHDSTGNDGAWTVETLDYTSAPDFVITVNTSENITDATIDGTIWPDLSAGNRVQLQTSGPIFESGHVDSLWQIITSKDAEIAYGTLNDVETSEDSGAHTTTLGYVEITFGQTLTVTSSGTWTGIIVLEKSVDSGATWKSVSQVSSVNDDQLAISRVEDKANVARYRLNMIERASGSAKYNLTAEAYEVEGVVKITIVTDSSNVVAEIKSVIGAADVTSERWSEGAWSAVRGYPRAVTFFEQRSVFGGTVYEPTNLWLSVSKPGGDHLNFAAGADADRALTYTLTQSQDPIKWLAASERLIIGTAGGPFTLGSNSLNEPLTPTNIGNVRRHGVRGGTDIMPVATDIGNLFVDRGGLEINELTYSIEQDGLVVTSMSTLADHLTRSGIKAISFQNRPVPVLWAITDDGTVCTLTYLRNADIVCWTEQITDGTYEDVCVVPGDTEDEVSFVVNRTIGGDTKRYVEKLAAFDWGDDQEDCFFVHCGITYEGDATDVITGLDHLEGKEVAVLVNGGLHPNQTVTGNQITLANGKTTTKAQIGLPYNSIITTMIVARGTLGSATPKRVSTLAVTFYRTGYAQYYIDSNDKQTVDLNDGAHAVGEFTTLFTGTPQALSPPVGYKRELTLSIESDKPLPMAVSLINILLEAS